MSDEQQKGILGMKGFQIVLVAVLLASLAGAGYMWWQATNAESDARTYKNDLTESREEVQAAWSEFAKSEELREVERGAAQRALNEYQGRLRTAQSEVNGLRQALVNEEARVDRLSRDLRAAQAEVGRSGANENQLRAAQAEVNRLRSELQRAQQSSTSQSGVVRELGQSIGCGGRDVARMIQTLGVAAYGWLALVPEDVWGWLLNQLCDWLGLRL